jgi:hypothetical protein
VCGAAAAPPQFGNEGNTALMEAAVRGSLDCLQHLITKGANLETTDRVRPPSAPSAPRPPPSPPAAPVPPRAHHHRSPRVWRRRRASAERLYGPHARGSPWRSPLRRPPHRQGRQRECPEPCASQPCCGLAAWGVVDRECARRGCAPLPRCPAGGWCPAAAAAPPRRAAAPLPAAGPRIQAGRGASIGLCGGGGAGLAGGLRPPQAPATHPPAVAAHPRVCGAAAASRHRSRGRRRCASRLNGATLPASSRCSRRGPTRTLSAR